MKKIIKLSAIKNKIFDILFPKNIKCIFCGDELNETSHNCTCENCYPILPFINNECDRCGTPVNPENIGVCLNCKTRNFNFCSARSVFGYCDEVLNVVQNLKYNGKRFLGSHMADFMLEKFATLNIPADIITCVPMRHKKEKQRGYNQSGLLAQDFADKIHLPFLDCCEKVVDNPSQTTLSFDERMKNVKDTFKFKKEFKQAIKDKVVLIIDDVITTGATTSELSKVLKEHGAKECFVLSFAHSFKENNINLFKQLYLTNN
jgi:competence protein ComFC